MRMCVSATKVIRFCSAPRILDALGYCASARGLHRVGVCAKGDPGTLEARALFTQTKF